MRVCSLSSVKNRIVLGEPLQFSVRDAVGMLLLARGQIIADEPQLQALFKRGAQVEADEIALLAELDPPVRREAPAPRIDRLAAEWERATGDVQKALMAPPATMAGAIHGATDLLLSLIHRAPDVALSQVVRRPDAGAGHYGVNHSVHAATACHAAARFLGWGVDEQRRAFQSALTMNLGMLDLQARLATQVSPLTAKQREAIHAHPTRSAEMLAEAGVNDTAWIDAVREHHEVPDGSGYPRGLTEVGALTEMLRFADVYTARLSSRANRPAMSAQQAGRELHQIADSSPLAAALIKAFGVFPPGSMVKLASGELGVVVRNGDKAHHPLVATLTNNAGVPRLASLMRDTAREEFAVVALLSAQAMPMRLSDERVAELIVGH